MELESILKIIDAVSQSTVMNFEIEDKDFRLFIDKNMDINPHAMNVSAMPAVQQPVVQVAATAPVVAAQPVAAQPVAAEQPVAASQEKAGNIVKSPIVGTFYSAAGPEAEDYVKVGDKVKKGQVLCIIEAMKLMNEIESEFDGEIAEILVKNEQMVEFGQPLFRIV